MVMMSGHFAGVDIIYSIETCVDAWIEKEVAALRDDGCPRVWVVTSDRCQQQATHGAGAFVWSAKAINTNGEIIGLFGVFDGHVGARAAEYVKHHFFNTLIKHPKFISDTKAAISSAYSHTNTEFLKSENNQNRDAGSTTSTAILVGDHLLVANVGDSRAVISRGGKAFAVSHDHKPDQLIVGGVLAVSRALGDKLLKQYVMADPDIQKESWKLQFWLGFNP
ncbi:putative protein-serine/threonine phosphatase [Helianthus anomalus]